MKFVHVLAGAALLCASSLVAAADDPAEVDAVIAAVRAQNADMKALCQGGADAVRKASGDAVRQLATAGKIKGDPRSVGAAAGAKIGAECRG